MWAIGRRLISNCSTHVRLMDCSPQQELFAGANIPPHSAPPSFSAPLATNARHFRAAQLDHRRVAGGGRDVLVVRAQFLEESCLPGRGPEKKMGMSTLDSRDLRVGSCRRPHAAFAQFLPCLARSFPALARGSRLDHRLYSFRNRHEIPAHVRMDHDNQAPTGTLSVAGTGGLPHLCLPVKSNLLVIIAQPLLIRVLLVI